MTDPTNLSDEAGEADPVKRFTVWECRTVAGTCVVRVEGVQPTLDRARESVLVLPAMRGAPSLTFQGSDPRLLTVDGLRRRYRPTTAENAEKMVRSTRPAPTRGGRKKETKVDERQVELADASNKTGSQTSTPEVPPSEPWECDVIVLNAGIGGASIGVRALGLKPYGVDGDARSVEAHCANAGPCAWASSAFWEPSGPAKAVLCLRPTTRWQSGVVAPETVVEGQGAQGEEKEVREESSADPRQIAAFRVGRQCGAAIVLVEVKLGAATSKDMDPLIVAASKEGYVAQRYRVDAAYLGLPQHRPTEFLIAFRGGGPATPGKFRGPPVAFAPLGNTGGLPSFRTVREALGLSGRFLTDAEPNRGPKGPRLDIDAPSPPIRPPKGVAAKITADPDTKDAPPPRALTTEELGILQGLPSSVQSVGTDKQRRHQILTAFAPVLAEKLLAAALQHAHAADPSSTLTA